MLERCRVRRTLETIIAMNLSTRNTQSSRARKSTLVRYRTFSEPSVKIGVHVQVSSCRGPSIMNISSGEFQFLHQVLRDAG